jgi:hypothetical protein
MTSVTSNSGLTLTRPTNEKPRSDSPLDEEAFIVAGYASPRRSASHMTSIEANSVSTDPIAKASIPRIA